jgi:hypothetical protein
MNSLERMTSRLEGSIAEYTVIADELCMNNPLLTEVVQLDKVIHLIYVSSFIIALSTQIQSELNKALSTSSQYISNASKQEVGIEIKNTVERFRTLNRSMCQMGELLKFKIQEKKYLQSLKQDNVY